ncbi:MAG: tyrosine decarboxylase MfnA [Candidatus Thermoplasmatota archaeon]|jgi:tyrosine decarboxylase/aspartate 1-decarboxylase|nr:tyrosine decarboxylase MfnA [Candidatus Thermoplasmatota archaeon]
MEKRKHSKKKHKIILKELDKYRYKDFTFASGRILGSMCTQPHPIAKEAYFKFLETNLGDPELFPGTKNIETKLISFISDLLNAPKGSGGQIVSGGTEGNINAMWLAKRLTNKKEIIVPGSAHFSFQKIASLMDMKIVITPLNKDYVIDTVKLKEKIGKDTAAVVGVAGSTELGTIDPIPEISEICLDEHVFLHVDAAFGGFVIPFLKQLGYDVPDFDFKLKGVSTVSIDAHKMGYSAIPLGVLIFRNKEWVDEISVESNCVSSERQSGILGTRSGGPVAAAYAVIRYLGKNGYRDLVKRCMENTYYTQCRIEDIGLKLVTKPIMNVIGVRMKKPAAVVNKLTEYGWKVNKMNRISCIRIVLMPHVTKKVIDRFIPDLKKVCEEVGEL